MTREDFIQRYQAQKKDINRWTILWMVCFFSFFIGCGIVCTHLGPLSRRVELAIKIGLVLIVTAQFPLIIWMAIRSNRKFGMHCPSCDKPLSGPRAELAIATGRCGNCGAELFSATATDSVSS